MRSTLLHMLSTLLHMLKISYTIIVVYMGSKCMAVPRGGLFCLKYRLVFLCQGVLDDKDASQAEDTFGKTRMTIALHQERLNQRDISQRVRCSQPSVHYIIKKERECGSVRDKKIPGRKRKTTSREDRALVRSSLSNRGNTAPALKASLHKSFGINLSTSTVKRRLREAGAHCRSQSPTVRQ